MPIYEYECGKCGHQFEFLVLPTSPKAACPECKSRKLNRQISLCAISSDSTKQKGLQAAKKRDKKLGKELAHADHEYRHKEMMDR